MMYGSESVYCLLRFLYAIYERLIKMGEVSQGQDKTNLFKVLFCCCIKVKESVRF